MVRTVLRSRSGDVASAVQLADRTGIVAASTPPPVETEEMPLPPVVFGVPEPPHRPRRVRRNLLFAGAAALFLLVGWIAGGTLGHHDGPAPAMASAPMADQVPPAVADPAPMTEPSKPPAAAPEQAPVAEKKPVTSTTRASTDRKRDDTPATQQSQPVQPRTDSTAPVSAPYPVQTVSEQFRELVQYWMLVNAQAHSTGNIPDARSYGSGH